ncbi:unnamed protein product [Blepharisma stoltei]|uniref:Uncharacterized protein n=1 Tax=Blepharisma stoltei TaxID=1481888 RepID=A0AAU9IX92_9CILI|nr:unnamed protein product [Blepharisma stoltei]
MKIFIKYKGKSIIELKFEENTPYREIKTMIENKLLVPASEQTLTYLLSEIESKIADDQLFSSDFKHYCFILKRNADSPIAEDFYPEISGSYEFFEACKEGDINKVTNLLANSPELIAEYSADGLTGLHYAACSGNIQLFTLLCQFGADINQISKDGKWSPLHMSCIQGHLGITDYLLRQKNIQIDLETPINATPLHCACLRGSYEIVELLLQSKANYSIENQFGKTPIEMAANKEIRELISKYMGTAFELPGIFEGKLWMSKFIGKKRVWAVLKPEEGEFLLYKDNWDRNELLESYNLDDFQEIKRCKPKFLSHDFSFRMTLKNGTKENFYLKTEESANEWVKSMFAALLYRQNKSRALKTKHFISLEEFPVTSEVNYFSFEIEETIGKSEFSTVYLVKKKDTGVLYALKSILKDALSKQNYTKYAVSEANILKSISFPYIIKLEYSFQSERSLFLVMEYCSNGSLSNLLKKIHYISERIAKIWAAELVVAIKHLNRNNVVFRDLKPENILFDSNWRIKVSDFGLAKGNVQNEDTTSSFCGSPAYFSPEMLNKEGVGKSVDIYGIGCILYEMLVGYPPFYSELIENTLKKIDYGKLKFPKYVSKPGKNLIKKLLNRNPNLRPTYEEIECHNFFEGINWDLIELGTSAIDFQGLNYT